MTGFDSDWLRLREAADARARAGVLEHLLVRALPRREALRVADLGCGNANNLRHLAPLLGRRQHWRLLDSDPALLAAVPDELAAWAATRGWDFREDGAGLHLSGPEAHVTVARERADLATAPLPVQGLDLVTGSALLDLVSQDWLARLAARCAAESAAAFFVLSYDGRIAWAPPDGFDDELRALVNRHQRRDKGFGPALGPGAHAAAMAVFRAEGFQVDDAASDWRLTPEDARLQQYLHAGWAAAAAEMAPERQDAIRAWLTRRIDLLAAGTAHVSVGHMDLLALPSGRPESGQDAQ